MIRVMIGVATAETARRAAFYDYLMALKQPMGTMLSFVHGQSIARGRNLIVRQALDNGCSHIFFLDDDTTFEPDTLIKLICHNVDMVTGLHLMRNYPHRPLIFDYFNNKGEAHIRYLDDDDSGLIKIAGSGLGCCLLKCKVFSRLEEPWFRLGEVVKDDLGEDLGFFNRAVNIGLQHYVDLDCLIGHMASTTVRPHRNANGMWMTTYDTVGEDVVSFPQLKSSETKELIEK